MQSNNTLRSNSAKERVATGTGRAILAATALAMGLGTIAVANPASARDEFKNAFEFELGRIVAHEVASIGHAIIRPHVAVHREVYVPTPVHYPVYLYDSHRRHDHRRSWNRGHRHHRKCGHKHGRFDRYDRRDHVHDRISKRRDRHRDRVSDRRDRRWERVSDRRDRHWERISDRRDRHEDRRDDRRDRRDRGRR